MTIVIPEQNGARLRTGQWTHTERNILELPKETDTGIGIKENTESTSYDNLYRLTCNTLHVKLHSNHDIVQHSSHP
jgi:hypothetical protein